MSAGASSLSLVASGLYALVVLASLIAANSASHSKQPSWHWQCWCALAALFCALAIARVFALEDIAREAMRELLRSSETYADRRTLQAPIAALVLGGAALGVWVWIRRIDRRIAGRRNQAVALAGAAGTGIILLIAVRLISFSYLDYLLYGPLKLNWFADLGLTLTAGAAALYYARRVRHRD